MPQSPVETLVDRLTLEEQVKLLSGEDNWTLPAIPRLGIGKLIVTDGPNGARGGGSLIGGVSAAAFPVGIALGAGWDPLLAEEIGLAIAEEAQSKGAHVLLGPMVNIHRSVTNGRNFECYSEDPELAAALVVGYVRALQAGGIAATVKHFAGNESEFERTTIDTVADERTLREIYLRPFEDAVKKAGTWAIMSSYNRLKGTYAAESGWLLTEVLRGDWGFDGAIMSDWFGSRSTAPTVNAGLDLEMPGPTRDRGARLISAVEAGEVTRATVRACALNVLKLLARTGALHDTGPRREIAENRSEHRALIRRAGAACAVLLKNDGVLPLGAPTGTVAVIGPNAKHARVMGGGSAQLNPHYTISPWQGLAARLGEEALVFAEGCTNHRWEPLLEGELDVAYFATPDLTGGVVHEERMVNATSYWVPPIAEGKVDMAGFSARIRGTFVPEVTGLHRVGIHSAGYSRVLLDGEVVADAREGNWQKGRTFFEEGCDEVVGAVDLTAGRTYAVTIEFMTRPTDNLDVQAFRAGIGVPLGDADIAAAADAAAGAETAIVFVGRSGEWDTEGSDLDDIVLPGRQDELVRAVAAANPRTVVVLQTGGPVEMPWVDDVPAILQAWYPGQEAGNAIADVLFGDAEPAGRLPQTFPRRLEDNPTHGNDPEVYPGVNGRVRYAEGVFIGYRHYERRGIAPLFPFGHGLGYTRFSMRDLRIARHGAGARMNVTLQNDGERRGTTVVQVYVGDRQASVQRPVRELEAFAKATLDPGESRVVALDLPPRAFAFFDTAARLWRIEPGEFDISVGFSATDIRLFETVDLPGATLEP